MCAGSRGTDKSSVEKTLRHSFFIQIINFLIVCHGLAAETTVDTCVTVGMMSCCMEGRTKGGEGKACISLMQLPLTLMLDDIYLPHMLLEEST